MKNKYYLFLLLTLIILASCQSKRAVVNTLTSQAVMNKDITFIDTTNAIDAKSMLNQTPLKESIVQKKDTLPRKEDKTAKIKYSTSKVSASAYPGPGVEQIAAYDFTHSDVPKAFDGFRIAFISDLHYKSLLQEKGLNSLVRLLIEQKADVLLMGGDYQEGCEFVEPLFTALSKVKTPMGTYGIMGNNDYERCHDSIIKTMEGYGMHVLEHTLDTLRKDGQQIILAGVRNPFDITKNGKSPTLSLSPNDFVILLTHTPDYAEDVSIANTDLALAGHTHGGQVRIFGIAPVLVSHYGSRFLTGLTYNSAKIPMIITNGIGTSQKPIRFGAPAEIVMITLRRMDE